MKVGQRYVHIYSNKLGVLVHKDWRKHTYLIIHGRHRLKVDHNLWSRSFIVLYSTSYDVRTVYVSPNPKQPFSQAEDCEQFCYRGRGDNSRAVFMHCPLSTFEYWRVWVMWSITVKTGVISSTLSTQCIWVMKSLSDVVHNSEDWSYLLYPLNSVHLSNEEFEWCGPWQWRTLWSYLLYPVRC